MIITVTGYSFIEGELHLFGTNVSDYNLQRIERNRYDDGKEEELEFIFKKEDFDYLYHWLKRQKAVNKSEAHTIGEAVRATLGIVTTISGKYLELA